MSNIAVRNTTALAVEEETTEGVYVAPTAAASYVQTLDSGLDFKNSKALLERNVFAGTIGKITPRTGEKSVTGTVPTECRAFSVEGSAPEVNSLLKSAFGTRHQNTTVVTTKTGNTASVLQIQDADITKFNVNEIILVKKAGAFHVSPIASKTTGTGTATITLKIAHPSGSLPDGVTIAKCTNYTVAESGHPTLSLTKYIDSAIRETAFGCRVNKWSLANFATGKIPTFSFGFEGLNFDTTLTAPTYTPAYDSALPPITLNAKAYMDGTEVTLNDISVSMDNTLGFATGFNTTNGKIASRVTLRKLTGTIDPYQYTDDISNFTKFTNNTEFSLFAYAKNDTGVAGEFQNVVAVYLPKCLITDLTEADAQGLVQQKIAFEATRGSDAATNEIYLCFV